MKITGNRFTTRFEVESMDEVYALKVFAQRFGNHVVSFAAWDGYDFPGMDNVKLPMGIEVPTQQLISLVSSIPLK